MNDHLIYDSYDVQIGSVGAKLYQHINNDDIHLSEEDRQKLDSIKLNSSDSEDGTTIGDLQIELNNKADKDDIPTKVSQLENDLNFLSEIPDYYTTEEEVKLLIEELAGSGDGSGDNPDLSDIQDQIDELTRLVNQYGITIEQLRQLIEENTSDITNLEETIQNIEQNIINLGDRITNIEEGGGGGGSYELPVATGTRLGGVKIGSGINVTADGTISAASSGSGGEGGLTPGDIATLDERYLRKDTDDETTHSITVPKLLSEDFLSGIDGTGFYLGNKAYDGKDTYSHLEIDNLLVRNKAVFEELEIRKLSYVNGNIVLSAAGGTIESVKDQGTSWKCYLKSDDGTTATTNTFQVNDLVRCETFDIKEGVYEGVSNKFYWRQVTEVGEDGNKNYIVLDKSNCAPGSDEPEAGDVIVQFGNSDNEQTNRQNIIIISATDEDSPSIKMYSRVISYDLNDAVLNSIISPGQVAFRTNLFRLISGDSYNPVCVDRGEYNPSTVYNYWDRVSYEGSLYLNVYQEGTTQGIAPGNTTYWMLQVEKGDKGDKGDAGDPGPQGPQGPPGEATDIGDGYQVSVVPNTCVGEYRTDFDDQGLIESFYAQSLDFDIYVYKNGELIRDAVNYTGDTNTDKVRIWVEAVASEISNSNTLDVDTNPEEDWTAQFSFDPFVDFGNSSNAIPTALTHNNALMYWPATKGRIEIKFYIPNTTDPYIYTMAVDLTITGATSFWEVTADHWISRFGQIEGNFANYSTIEQTAEAISASVTEINGELDTMRQSIADITAGKIDFSVIADKMRKAGINISLDEGADTGTVQIYGDKVTIKNRENGDDILWVEGNTAKMSNVNIVGGTIGGYNIENNKIHSSSTSGTINIDVDSIELKSKSTINDEFSNPYPVSQIRMSSSYKEDQGVSLGGHVYSSLLVRAQHSGTLGIHTGIFIDAAKSDNIDMYGITSFLPSDLRGIQNYGGEQYLWLPLTNNRTISLNIGESSKYIYYGSSNISITLPIPRTNYLDSNTIQIFVATQSNVTVKGSGCKIMYNKYNGVVDGSSTEKATSVGLNHWGIYTFVYVGSIIGDRSNYWICTYNVEVFK